MQVTMKSEKPLLAIMKSNKQKAENTTGGGTHRPTTGKENEEMKLFFYGMATAATVIEFLAVGFGIL